MKISIYFIHDNIVWLEYGTGRKSMCAVPKWLIAHTFKLIRVGTWLMIDLELSSLFSECCELWHRNKHRETEKLNMCKTSCIRFCSSWIRPVLVLLYILFVLICLPVLIYNTVKDGLKKDQLILIGGLFVACSIPICLWHIMQHISHFTKPILQKPIIRILWMVPIYAIDAVRIANMSFLLLSLNETE